MFSLPTPFSFNLFYTLPTAFLAKHQERTKERKKKKRIIPPNKGNVSDRDIAKKGISHSILPLLPFPHHATPGGRGHNIIFMSSRRS